MVSGYGTDRQQDKIDNFHRINAGHTRGDDHFQFAIKVFVSIFLSVQTVLPLSFTGHRRSRTKLISIGADMSFVLLQCYVLGVFVFGCVHMGVSCFHSCFYSQIWAH